MSSDGALATSSKFPMPTAADTFLSPDGNSFNQIELFSKDRVRSGVGEIERTDCECFVACLLLVGNQRLEAIELPRGNVANNPQDSWPRVGNSESAFDPGKDNVVGRFSRVAA